MHVDACFPFRGTVSRRLTEGGRPHKQRANPSTPSRHLLFRGCLLYTSILELKQELLTIDGLFAALSENEAFVIRHHVMEELDWPQTMVLFAQKWGADVEKSIRSMKALQEKGSRKVARILNKRINHDLL